MSSQSHNILPDEIFLLKQLAKSWNTLSVHHIEEYLAEVITYESQWVLFPIRGKENTIKYLDSKFSAISNFKKNRFMKIHAVLAQHPDLRNKPCILLSQETNKEMINTTIVITNKGRVIHRIDVCFIPDPLKAIPL